jgi:hypothetical protein
MGREEKKGGILGTLLTRWNCSGRTVKERWVQDLLYERSSLIPVGEIEPVFEGLRPLASEVPTGSGSLDLLFMNGEGRDGRKRDSNLSMIF